LLHDDDDDVAAGSGELLHNDDATPQLPPLMAEPPEITAEQPGPSHSPTGAMSELSPASAPMGQSISSPAQSLPLLQPSPPLGALR